MSSLVQYYDSDEDDDTPLVADSALPHLASASPVSEKSELPSAPKLSLGLSSLPAPKHSKRRRLPLPSESDHPELLNPISQAETNSDGPAASHCDNGIESEALFADSAETVAATVPKLLMDDEVQGPSYMSNGIQSEALVTDSTETVAATVPKLLMDDEAQGPSYMPAYEPPALPHIRFRDRVVPPPGLNPPPGLKLNGEIDVCRPEVADDLPADQSFVNGLRKGNVMELNQDDLRRFELSRPVDPLGASRGELIQSEIAASLWTSKQGQLLSTASATFNQSRRHHINSMATTAALMEESIRQSASVGQDRRRMAKAKYGW